ncbi:hypothetical protein ID866_7152 [Astraeus odoratus]|nr:hypothetical protein ID866_7152 [Astraeus odoratus]
MEAAGGGPWKWRRTQAKEGNREDNVNDNEGMEGDDSFVVLAAFAEVHWDALGVRGLKALQKEMRKANALKAKELKALTKGKEKAAELLEESSESSDKEEEVEGEGGDKEEVVEGKGSDGDRDVEMGTEPSASAM